jgi:two-component system chemotaxis response regulator CheB
VLWELRGDAMTRFRYRVGHAWSAQSLLDQQLESLETSLWVALRSLEERSALAHRLRDSATARGNSRSAEHFEEQAGKAEAAAERIRDFLLSKSGQSHDERM